nr:hypothetical protein [Tanacetum cinerariifolium]
MAQLILFAVVDDSYSNRMVDVTGGGQGGAIVVQAALHIGEGTAHE